MRKKRRRRRQKKGNWFTRLSMKKRVAICVAGVLLLLIAAVVIFVASKFAKMNTETIEPDDIIINDLPDEVGKGYTNVALFGGDSRTGQLGKGARTDAIIVVSLNNATKEVKMVSIYRDTLLDTANGKIQKCNAAHSAGGPQQAINMLNMNLDLDIQKYVTVDFKAVSDVVDLVGGIEVDVSEAEMKATNLYIPETARVAGKKANYISHPGLQTLDGVQATTYARIRKGVGDDYQRTVRQRLVIEKVAQKVMKSDLKTLNSIIDKVFPAISTNFTMAEILSYAKDITKYKIGESQGFPKEKTSATIPGKGSCVIPVTLKSNVQALHEFLYGTVDYQPSAKVNSISSQIQSLVGERKPDGDVPYTEKPNSGNGNSGTNTNTPTPPTVDNPNKEKPNSGNTPGTGEGGGNTPGTGGSSGSIPGSGEGGGSTSGTGEGGGNTPGTGESGGNAPGTGEGGGSIPGTGEGGGNTPGTGEGGGNTPGTGESGGSTPGTEEGGGATSEPGE